MTKNKTKTNENRTQVFQAAFIVMMAMLLSRFLGLIRDAVINSYFDALSVEANAYAVASRFPQLIFTVIAGGALGSAFIPTFSAFFTRDDEAGGWRLFATIISLVVAVVAVIAGIAALFAPLLVKAFTPVLVSNYPTFLPMTTALLRVMLLSAIIFSVSGVVMGSLNARHHFLMPALAGSVYNLGIILGVILFPGNVMGLGYGVVLGALGHLLVQLPALKAKGGQYYFRLSVRDESVKQVLKLMAPRMLGLSFGEITLTLTQFLAQSLVLGSIRSLDLAWKVMSMPLGFIGQALGIAAFPTFATLAAAGEKDEMRKILADTIRLILFFGMPAMVMLIILRQPIVTALLQYRTASETSTNFIAWALLFYAMGLLPLAIIEIVARAFYALGDTVTPVIAGAFQLGVMAILGLWLSRWVFPAQQWLTFGGLALGHSLANWVEVTLLVMLLRRKMEGIAGNYLLNGFWRMGLAGLAMGLVSYGVLMVSGNALRPSSGSTSIFLTLIISTIAGTIAYMGTAYMLGLSELKSLWRGFSARLHL